MLSNRGDDRMASRQAAPAVAAAGLARVDEDFGNVSCSAAGSAVGSYSAPRFLPFDDFKRYVMQSDARWHPRTALALAEGRK